jgi:hypothetical protein
MGSHYVYVYSLLGPVGGDMVDQVRGTKMRALEIFYGQSIDEESSFSVITHNPNHENMHKS